VPVPAAQLLAAIKRRLQTPYYTAWFKKMDSI